MKTCPDCEVTDLLTPVVRSCAVCQDPVHRCFECAERHATSAEHRGVELGVGADGGPAFKRLPRKGIAVDERPADALFVGGDR